MKPSSVVEVICVARRLKRTSMTHPLWFRVARHSPVSKSQILTVWSFEPDATHVPSGLTATLLTQFVWPVSLPSSTASGSDFVGGFSDCGFSFAEFFFGVGSAVADVSLASGRQA